MLHRAFCLSSKIFHQEPISRFYDSYLKSKKLDIDNPSTVNEHEMKLLKRFLNQWRTHYQSSYGEMLEAIMFVLPNLVALKNEDILHVDFKKRIGDNTTSEHIAQIFNVIADCGPRFEATGASKILHTLNPNLFIMWDAKIREGYGVYNRGNAYATSFLPKIQRVAQRAVSDCISSDNMSKESAIKAICVCGHTVAKVVDEFNYVKFTLRRDEVSKIQIEDLF